MRGTPWGAIRRVMGSPCLSAAGVRFLSHPVPAVGLARSCDWVTGEFQTTTGYHGPHRQVASDELASRRREPGTVSAEPLIFADHYSGKDVSATFVPFCITTLQPRLHVCSTRVRLLLAEISVVATYFLCAFTACLRPNDYSLRPGSMEMGVRCAPSLASPPYD